MEWGLELTIRRRSREPFFPRAWATGKVRNVCVRCSRASVPFGGPDSAAYIQCTLQWVSSAVVLSVGRKAGK